MDPRTNPYAPGAGTLPPELTGRDEIIQKVAIALDRCRNGLSARGLLLVGLRGVGKTVLLTRMAQDAMANGFAVVSIETPEKRSLPALIIPSLRAALLKLDRVAATGETIKHIFRILGGFITAMKLKYKKEDHFAALIRALHKCAQYRLPILLIGAGLPQLVGQAGRAKSYSERLFEYPEIGPLSETAARKALEIPAEKLHVQYDKDALVEILAQTQAYPYFLQEWGKYSWECAKQSPITLNDVKLATELAISELDTSFFRVRFDRLTPGEKKYLRAMAELGPGPHRSGDIAHLLKKEVQTVAPTRATLIIKGMIYSPSHGDTAFTVPLFNGYMKRVIPN